MSCGDIDKLNASSPQTIANSSKILTACIDDAFNELKNEYITEIITYINDEVTKLWVKIKKGFNTLFKKFLCYIRVFFYMVWKTFFDNKLIKFGGTYKGSIECLNDVDNDATDVAGYGGDLTYDDVTDADNTDSSTTETSPPHPWVIDDDIQASNDYNLGDFGKCSKKKFEMNGFFALQCAPPSANDPNEGEEYTTLGGLKLCKEDVYTAKNKLVTRPPWHKDECYDFEVLEDIVVSRRRRGQEKTQHAFATWVNARNARVESDMNVQRAAAARLAGVDDKGYAVKTYTNDQNKEAEARVTFFQVVEENNNQGWGWVGINAVPDDPVTKGEKDKFREMEEEHGELLDPNNGFDQKYYTPMEVWNGIRETKTPSNQPPEGYFKLPEDFKMCSKDNMMSIVYYSEKEKDACQREESGGFDDCVKQCLNEYADPEFGPYFDVPDVNGNTTDDAEVGAPYSDIPDVNGNTPDDTQVVARTPPANEAAPLSTPDDWSEARPGSFRRDQADRRARQRAAVETYAGTTNTTTTRFSQSLGGRPRGNVTIAADYYAGAKPGSLDYEKHMDIYEYDDWKKRVLGGTAAEEAASLPHTILSYDGRADLGGYYSSTATVGDYPAWTPINANVRFSQRYGIKGPPGDCIQTCKNNYYMKFDKT